MTLGAIRERLTMFREFGVSRASFYGPHLTEIEFWPVIPEADEGTGASPGSGNEETEGGALYRLNSRGARKAGGES